MEFIKGTELKDYFDRNERLDLATIYRLMTELLAALDFAHEANIIHRDVKPANVMIDANGMPSSRIRRGALYRARGRRPDERTRVGTIIGTPSYMSPEQDPGPAARPAHRMCFGRRDPATSCSPSRSRSKARSGRCRRRSSRTIRCGRRSWSRFRSSLDRIVAPRARQAARSPLPERARIRRRDQARRRGKPLEGHDDVFAKAAGQAVEPTEAEKEFWNEVKDSTEADEIGLYIEQFPHGAFVALAKKKIAALGGK
jgi:hypothetical protein